MSLVNKIISEVVKGGDVSQAAGCLLGIEEELEKHGPQRPDRLRTKEHNSRWMEVANKYQEQGKPLPKVLSNLSRSTVSRVFGQQSRDVLRQPLPNDLNVRPDTREMISKSIRKGKIRARPDTDPKTVLMRHRSQLRAANNAQPKVEQPIVAPTPIERAKVTYPGGKSISAGIGAAHAGLSGPSKKVKTPVDTLSLSPKAKRAEKK